MIAQVFKSLEQCQSRMPDSPGIFKLNYFQVRSRGMGSFFPCVSATWTQLGLHPTAYPPATQSAAISLLFLLKRARNGRGHSDRWVPKLEKLGTSLVSNHVKSPYSHGKLEKKKLFLLWTVSNTHRSRRNTVKPHLIITHLSKINSWQMLL